MYKYLVPFVATTILYFYRLIPSGQPSALAVILKCLPIYSLAGAAYLHGKSKRSKLKSDEFVFYGLLVSGIGDALLLWRHLFYSGILAFAVAHICYISAFGLKPLKPLIGIVFYGVLGVVLAVSLPNIKDDILMYGIPVYGLLLVATAWRAVVKAMDKPNPYSWQKIACAVGAILFVVSDTIFCFHELQKKSIPYGQILIMATYYAAQLGITLSVAGAPAGKASTKSKKKSEPAKSDAKKKDQKSEKKKNGQVKVETKKKNEPAKQEKKKSEPVKGDKKKSNETPKSDNKKKANQQQPVKSDNKKKQPQQPQQSGKSDNKQKNKTPDNNKKKGK